MPVNGFKLAYIVLPFVLWMTGCSEPYESDVPESVIRQNTLGTAYLGQQEWGSAADSFRGALAERADDPLLLSNLAVALMQAGKPDEAVTYLRAAIAADPGYAYAHYNLGLIETNRGNFDAAVSHFEAVVEFDPDDVSALYNLGRAYASLERDREAIEALRHAIDIDPDHVSSLYALGRRLVNQGDREQGHEFVRRSQLIRARSGLDTAVGSQYGEQGPYALGADYPADVLAAPKPSDISFSSMQRHPTAESGLWVLVPMATDRGVALIVSDGSSLGRLTPDNGFVTVLPSHPDGLTILSLTAGDGDNDEIVEIYALVNVKGAVTRLAVIEQSERGEFTWADAGLISGTVQLPERVTAADLLLVDRDHDGDLDLLLCWSPSPASSCALATNDGSGRMMVAESVAHGFDLQLGDAKSIRLGLSDFDNDRDIDLLVAHPGGIHLLSNQRDGTFAEAGTQIGLGQSAAGYADVILVDLDKDGWMDVVAGGQSGLWLYTNRRGKFTAATRIAGHATPVGTVTAFDADNDGFLDLVVSDMHGGSLAYRNMGRGEWRDSVAWFGDTGDIAAAAAYDADRDGDLDLVGTTADSVAILENEGGNSRHWISVESNGVGGNRFGIGAKVEILSGALRQKFEVTSPLPVHIGLGPRNQVDSVRHLWPSGVLQDEIQLAADGSVTITQLDRKGTSCPILYVWRNGQWQFVTDFLGGAAIGYQKAPGVFSTPDTNEYIKLEQAPSIDSDGMLKVRVNNQLQEIIWFDQLELVAVDHPADTELFPNERLMPESPWPEFRLFVSGDIRNIKSATGIENRTDWTAAMQDSDGRYVDDFALLRFKGYSEMHTLELDLGPFSNQKRVVLLLDGWIDYADSTANIAASQAGSSLTPPILTVADGRGGWTDTGHLMGFPAGLSKTMAVELSSLFDHDDHRIRIKTNMRIYWDQARVLIGGEADDHAIHRLSPVAAELRYGGFPSELERDRGSPHRYDPAIVSSISPWSAHVGRYTGFGDVSDLLVRIDDRMVTTRAGDEIELSFRSPGPVPAAHKRTYLLFADGFGKDMDPNSAANNAVGPVPFHGMPVYPYPETVVPPVDVSDTMTRSVSDSGRGWPGAMPMALAPIKKSAEKRLALQGKR